MMIPNLRMRSSQLQNVGPRVHQEMTVHQEPMVLTEQMDLQVLQENLRMRLL